MVDLSKDEKKAFVKTWKTTQSKEYILTKENVQELFGYLEEKMETAGCDHTRHHTERWLTEHISQELIGSVITEITDMGGYCDCEVLLNCYEEYDIG